MPQEASCLFDNVAQSELDLAWPEFVDAVNGTPILPVQTEVVSELKKVPLVQVIAVQAIARDLSTAQAGLHCLLCRLLIRIL